MKTIKLSAQEETIKMPQGATGFYIDKIILDTPMKSHTDSVLFKIGFDRNGFAGESKTIDLTAFACFLEGANSFEVKNSFTAEIDSPTSIKLLLQYRGASDINFRNISSILKGDFVAKINSFEHE